MDSNGSIYMACLGRKKCEIEGKSKPAANIVKAMTLQGIETLYSKEDFKSTHKNIIEAQMVQSWSVAAVVIVD